MSREKAAGPDPALLEESAEELYEHAPCGYLSTLPDGTIVKVNGTFLTWTGHRREDLVGRRRFADLLSVGGRIYHETHLAPLLRMQGSVREIALEVMCTDGRRLPVLVNSTVKQDAQGTPLLIRTTVFQATDRKAYEQELLEARDRERAARERVERLQRLTSLLAGAVSAEAIHDAIVPELQAATGAARVVLETHDEEAGAAPFEPRFGETAAELPLVLDTRMIGVISLAFEDPHELSEADRAFLVACAGQCAQALGRVLLLRRTEESARHAAFHAEASRVLDQVPGFADRVRRLVDLLERRVGEHAWLELPDEPAERADPAVAAAVSRALSSAEPQITAPGHAVAVPLRVRGRLLGALVITRSAPRFEPGDLPFLVELADRAALALENARLYEQQRDVAHTLQQSLLGELPEGDPRFDVAAHYQPAIRSLEVGGDWYDIFPTGEDRIAIVVGDVVGRGIVAASAMGQLRSAVRALAAAGLGPGEVIDRLDAFATQIEPARWATLVYAELDLVSGDVRYAVAGHPPPLIIESGTPPRPLWDGRSPPLGIGGPRPEATLTLAPGGRLLLYTDGLVERRGVAVDEGIVRLIEELDHRRGAPLGSIAGQLAGVMLLDQDHDDDVCLLLVAFRAGSRSHHASSPVTTAA